MKNIKYILSFLIAFGMLSCEKRLEEEIFSIQTPDNFYNSPQEGYAGLNSIWGVMPRGFPRHLVYLTEGTTDNHGGPGWARLFSQSIVDMKTYNYDALSPLVEAEYSRMYRMIFRANGFIEAMEPKKWSQEDEPIRLAQIAEAKLYRGIAYFYLVRFFGGVPILTSIEQSADVTSIPRASIEEVYEQIISDIKAAQSDLPNRAEQPKGRAFKDVATGMLAKVYLTMGGKPLEKAGMFSQAVSEAKKVIANEGEHPLFDSYTDAFSSKAQNAGETMLSIQTFGAGAGFWYPSNTRLPFNPYAVEFVQAFEPGDERKEVTFWRYYGKQQKPVDPDTVSFANENDMLYCGKYRTDPAFVGAKPNWPILRYAEVLLIHAEAENEVNGPTAEAYASINKVRERADLPPLSGLSKEQFREALKHERRIELSMELKRWFDLVRWGDLVENVNAKFARRGEPYRASEKHTLFPIPQVEIQRNPAVEQNPGWE